MGPPRPPAAYAPLRAPATACPVISLPQGQGRDPAPRRPHPGRRGRRTSRCLARPAPRSFACCAGPAAVRPERLAAVAATEATEGTERPRAAVATWPACAALPWRRLGVVGGGGACMPPVSSMHGDVTRSERGRAGRALAARGPAQSKTTMRAGERTGVSPRTTACRMRSPAACWQSAGGSRGRDRRGRKEVRLVEGPEDPPTPSGAHALSTRRARARRASSMLVGAPRWRRAVAGPSRPDAGGSTRRTWRAAAPCRPPGTPAPAGRSRWPRAARR